MLDSLLELDQLELEDQVDEDASHLEVEEGASHVEVEEGASHLEVEEGASQVEVVDGGCHWGVLIVTGGTHLDVVGSPPPPLPSLKDQVP